MSAPVHFGYNPPSSDRGHERVDPATYVGDLERMLEVLGDGIDSVWVSDHFMSNDRFRLECWTLLTWIASRHPHLAIGTIVAAVGYRHAPLFAKMVASLDALMESAAEASGRPRARPILGLGAGWTEAEYRGYGYDFPPTKERIAELDEALTVAKLLWTGGPVDHAGEHFRLSGALALPAREPRPLIMVGGEGPTTMAVAGAPGRLVEPAPPAAGRGGRHARAHGRDLPGRGPRPGDAEADDVHPIIHRPGWGAGPSARSRSPR